ncbi:MAG: glycosyltransferase family 39 protein [bacterium]
MGNRHQQNMNESSTGMKPWKEAVLILLILALALYLRLGTLQRSTGRPLDPDVNGFIHFARMLRPFTDTGFYSARFGLREPLYLLVVKAFLELPGADEVNVRWVSLTFSLLVVLLTYLLVRTWMGKGVALLAAFLLAVHTYCIEASVRGLRCEFFTLLVLLLLYVTCINEGLGRYTRAVLAGVVTGLLLLTRTEFLLPAVLLFILLPLVSRSRWGITSAPLALLIGLLMLAPHLWGMYKVNGDVFYTSNLGARFYTNLEFAGKPGFPTVKEIEEKGMFVGPRITPKEYFLRLHTPKELLWGNARGLGMVYLALIVRYIPTEALHEFKKLPKSPAVIPRQTLPRMRYISTEALHEFKKMLKSPATIPRQLLRRHAFQVLLALLVGAGLLGGLLFLWRTDFWILYLYLILFQVQTAFLFSVGLETQVVAHTWPVALWVAAFFLVQAGERILGIFSARKSVSEQLALLGWE